MHSSNSCTYHIITNNFKSHNSITYDSITYNIKSNHCNTNHIKSNNHDSNLIPIQITIAYTHHTWSNMVSICFTLNPSCARALRPVRVTKQTSACSPSISDGAVMAR